MAVKVDASKLNILIEQLGVMVTSYICACPNFGWVTGCYN